MGNNENSNNADVIVLGMGPAGESVAGTLAEAGLDVIGIDRELVGGECPYYGCIPSKMMIRAAHSLAEARRVNELAGSASVTPDWSPVAQRIRDEATDDWNDQVAVDRFEGKGGRFVRGEGHLVGPGSVQVGDETYSAPKIVIATGTRAAVPPIPGLADTPFWTNREVVAVKTLPASLIVLGGGAIGTEIAQSFARFGVKVAIVEAQERLLPLEEPEVGPIVEGAFVADGIAIHTGVMASGVGYSDNEFTVSLSDGSAIVAEKLLIATGRRTELGPLGVASIGLEADIRFLSVDDHMRVADGVWAVGDITGEGLFTHVGMYQAPIVVASVLGQDHVGASYHALPRVTFTDPEVGSVGMSEAAAIEAGINVAVASQPVPFTARGWLHKSGNEGIIKLVLDKDAGVLVGATAAGPNGGEVLGLLSLAVHAKVPLATMKNMIFAYPTFHRGIEDAMNNLDA